MHTKKLFYPIVRSRWTYRVLAFLWMATIFWLSSKQSLPTPDLFQGQDKLEHLFAYGLLSFLLTLSFPHGRTGFFPKRLFVIVIFVGLYGFFDEFHQFFVPGRDASVWDLCADIAGGFLSALLFLHYRSRRFMEKIFLPLS